MTAHSHRHRALQVSVANAEYNQPTLRIDQASARRRRFIKSVSPHPDVESLESDTAGAGDSPRGKNEIAVQSDKLQTTGRKDDSGSSYSR